MNIRIGIGLLALCALGAGCSGGGSGGGDGGGGPVKTTMRFSGNVLRDSGSGGQPTALSQADVRASVDRNGDGVVGAGEAVAVKTDVDGKYVLDVGVKQGETVVVRFSNGGSATAFRTVKGAPRGNMLLSATLKDLEALSCTGSTCTAQSGLVMSGLPDGTSGSARVFNPVSDTDAFPGSFEDSDGKLLESGVFATFALEDGLGSPLENLATPATVKMRIPRDTWGVVKDIDAVAAGIQVPLYWFDEVKGTWIREGQGHLEDGDGATVPASALASIKDGSYAGALFAVGALTHFSSWNVDWPVETHGRIGGELGECWWNGERKPCAGATVTARGDSYTGTSTPQTVGDDGRFSIAVMRSEGPGEDLDGDGVTGEETDVALRAVWEGRVYDLGVTGMPATQATPGGGDTKDLGVLTLDDRPPNSNLLEVGLCTVTGEVLWSDGAPSVNATVWSWDDDIASDVWESLCLVDPFPCTLFASTDPEGAFSVTTPTLGGPTLWALNTREVGGDARVVEFALGSRTYGACPSGPVSLTLDQGYVSVSATVELTANVVSWTPAAFGAAFIEVVSETGLKWLVATDGVPMSSPITYGSVPAGAIQSFPEGASPAPLASGDIIWVLVYGTTASGVPYSGGGELVVP